MKSYEWENADSLEDAVIALYEQADAVHGEPVDDWYARALQHILESNGIEVE